MTICPTPLRPALLAGLAALALLARPAEAAETYAFDKNHTQIHFSYDHLGLTTQSGRFTGFDGTLVFDEQAPENSRLDVTIAAASVLTAIPPMDERLKGADFFDVANHPEIRFKSRAVRRTGAKTGEVAGDLTIKGVTRPVMLMVTFNFSGPHPLGPVLAQYKDVHAAAFSAHARVLRSDFKMGKFAPLTSDEIDIRIEAELHRTKE
ncbi:MAG: YceI family protein [Hyphomicrobiales bacterium]|nr:YceI family protein [Hyphomicrobiales bacterium]